MSKKLKLVGISLQSLRMELKTQDAEAVEGFATRWGCLLCIKQPISSTSHSCLPTQYTTFPILNTQHQPGLTADQLALLKLC